MAFGADAESENLEADLISPVFEDVPTQCFKFYFSLNVSFIYHIHNVQ